MKSSIDIICHHLCSSLQEAQGNSQVLAETPAPSLLLLQSMFTLFKGPQEYLFTCCLSRESVVAQWVITLSVALREVV